MFSINLTYRGMSRAITLVLTLLLLTVTTSIEMFNLVKLNPKSRALCLDGSPGAYYLWSDEIKGVNKLLVMFEDTPTGWCFEGSLNSSIAECAKWNTTDYGSTKDLDGPIIIWNGIMASGGG